MRVMAGIPEAILDIGVTPEDRGPRAHMTFPANHNPTPNIFANNESDCYNNNEHFGYLMEPLCPLQVVLHSLVQIDIQPLFFLAA